MGAFNLRKLPYRMSKFSTLIIGLGNPILGDDGIGWVIAEKLSKLTSSRNDLEFDYLSLGGLSLMERLEGYEKVFIIDAISSGSQEIGSIHQFTLSDLPIISAGHTIAAHDTDLRTAMQVGRSMNVELPDDKNVVVIGIETNKVYDFSEDLSYEVLNSIPAAIELCLSLI
jgi:hydrogenase maturation protease